MSRNQRNLLGWKPIKGGLGKSQDASHKPGIFGLIESWKIEQLDYHIDEDSRLPFAVVQKTFPKEWGTPSSYQVTQSLKRPPQEESHETRSHETQSIQLDLD